MSRVADGAANEQVFTALGQKAMTQVADYSVDELRVLGQALSKIKTRLLRKNGMRAVPAFTWDRDNQSRQECMDYLAVLLEPVSKETSRNTARPKPAIDVRILEEQLVPSAANVSFEPVCRICMCNVVFKPKVTKCSHIFCGECIDTWVKTETQKVKQNTMSYAELLKRTQGCGSAATFLVACPSCRGGFDGRTDLFPLNHNSSGAHAMLWRMLGETRVNCLAKDLGCTWSGTYGTHSEHVQACTHCTVSSDTVVCNSGTGNGKERAQRPLASKAKTRESDEKQTIRVVIADWTGVDKVQLSVSTGMRVVVHQVHPSGWAYGSPLDGGDPGWFPKVVLREARDEDDPSDCASTVDTITSPSERETPANTPEREAGAGVVASAQPEVLVRATHVFAPTTTEHHQLELWIGRTVVIVQEDPSGWSYGRCTTTDQAGWFPRAMTAVV